MWHVWVTLTIKRTLGPLLVCCVTASSTSTGLFLKLHPWLWRLILPEDWQPRSYVTVASHSRSSLRDMQTLTNWGTSLRQIFAAKMTRIGKTLSAPSQDWLLTITKIEKHFDRSLDLYNNLIDVGVVKECARFVLPHSSNTRLYMTGTCRSWIHYINLRSAHGTQKEHMDI